MEYLTGEYMDKANPRPPSAALIYGFPNMYSMEK